jgi:hypothetical protein
MPWRRCYAPRPICGRISHHRLWLYAESETLMGLKTYDMEVIREGRWWVVTVPEVGYRTQARTLSEVDDMGRDLIAGALGVAPESFELATHVHPPEDVTEASH